MSDLARRNRKLGLRINREVWNEGQVEKIRDYFADEFIADRAPYGVFQGLEELRASVERSHAPFFDFSEEVKAVIADEERVVLHFTIRGLHTGHWGPRRRARPCWPMRANFWP